MKALVVVSHPSPESFNHALADAVRRTWASFGCDVAFHDLYLERFQPLLTAEEERGAPSIPLYKHISPGCAKATFSPSYTPIAGAHRPL